MERKTTFKIGDTVWYIHRNKIKEGIIEKILFKRFLSPVSFEPEEVEIYYIDSHYFRNDEVFATKDELKNNLLL